jgi:hypothetical protein
MYIFLNQNSYLGKFWRDLQWKIVVHSMAIWSLLRPFGTLYGHLAYFVANCYILWLFSMFFPFWYVVPRKIWQPWSILRAPARASLQKISASINCNVELANCLLRDFFSAFLPRVGRLSNRCPVQRAQNQSDHKSIQEFRQFTGVPETTDFGIYVYHYSAPGIK